MKITAISIQSARDSRGEPTIAVTVAHGGREATTAIPSGKSRGKGEAMALPYAQADASAKKLAAAGIHERDFPDNRALDTWLMHYDATPRKERMGGNVALGISLSFAKVRAAAEEKELWEVIREEYFADGAGDARGAAVGTAPGSAPGAADGGNAAPAGLASHMHPAPRVFSNVINGGLHAGNGLAIQEYMVALEPYEEFAEGITALTQFYASLGGALRSGAFEGAQKDARIPRGASGHNGFSETRLNGEIPLGDEGGYAPRFASNIEPLRVLAAHIGETGIRAHLAIDAAAGSFWHGGAYEFEGAKLGSDALLKEYARYVEEIPFLVSIEDPFAEDDRAGFARIREALPDRLIVGDDLTVTDPARIEAAAREKLISGVIVKPNQIGTLTETCEAIRAARRHGLAEIISHRSGETDDVSIIHIAKACGAYGVKIGAPARERLLKFKELLRLYS